MGNNIFTPGPTPNTVRASDGSILTVPEGWALLPPGNAGLTRRVKVAGDHWIVQEKVGRLVNPGSDRAADNWRRADYQIEGHDTIPRHHLYRAMAWLGEELPLDQQADKTPFAPRCTKDRIEEDLFAQRRDLFTGLQMVFFDTTSIYFEGDGGDELGQRGFSKDHRPDL